MIQQGSGLPGLDQGNAWANCFPTGASSSFRRSGYRNRLDTISAKIVAEGLYVLSTKSPSPAVIRIAAPSTPSVCLRERTSAETQPTMRLKT